MLDMKCNMADHTQRQLCAIRNLIGIADTAQKLKTTGIIYLCNEEVQNTDWFICVACLHSTSLDLPSQKPSNPQANTPLHTALQHSKNHSTAPKVLQGVTFLAKHN